MGEALSIVRVAATQTAQVKSVQIAWLTTASFWCFLTHCGGRRRRKIWTLAPASVQQAPKLAAEFVGQRNQTIHRTYRATRRPSRVPTEGNRSWWLYCANSHAVTEAYRACFMIRHLIKMYPLTSWMLQNIKVVYKTRVAITLVRIPYYEGRHVQDIENCSRPRGVLLAYCRE